MGKPAKLNLPGAKTRFDELQAIHATQAYATHFVVCIDSNVGSRIFSNVNQGAFLPFHRLMLQSHEDALRSECGYTGYQPYVPLAYPVKLHQLILHSITQVLARATRCRKIHTVYRLRRHIRLRRRRLRTRKLHHNRPIQKLHQPHRPRIPNHGPLHRSQDQQPVQHRLFTG